jgi:hypothetical protein
MLRPLLLLAAVLFSLTAVAGANAGAGRPAHLLCDSYATQPGNVALDGSEGITKALAATMRSPGLDIFQTFNAVGLQVKHATGGSQQPWVASSPIDGSFYFVEGMPEIAAISPPSAAPEPEAKLARLPDPAGADAERPRGPSEDRASGPGSLVPAHGNNYGARNLLDGQDGTAWVKAATDRSEILS